MCIKTFIGLLIVETAKLSSSKSSSILSTLLGYHLHKLNFVKSFLSAGVSGIFLIGSATINWL